ncbi:MAG: sugar phosphate nucleotidyltransferase [Balneolaceae bacterium]|nr:sugar phosphate nucleotidyltransferase [Balneolaceae bacterium]
MKNNFEITGLVPAAGYASRISPIPCSKEIYPINYPSDDSNNIKSPKVISASLLEKFGIVGLEKVYMIIRKGKWDIPQYFGTGSSFGLNFAYLVTDPTPDTPHTIDKAYHFIKNKRVLLGFPDIQISHKNPFQKLLIQLENSGSDMVLGLFKTHKPYKSDMVETDKNNNVKKIIIKPDSSNLKYTWLLAVWNPVFTDFLHNFLSKHQSKALEKGKKELYIGDIIQKAIQNGLKVSSVRFPDSTSIDSRNN